MLKFNIRVQINVWHPKNPDSFPVFAGWKLLSELRQAVSVEPLGTGEGLGPHTAVFSVSTICAALLFKAHINEKWRRDIVCLNRKGLI